MEIRALDLGDDDEVHRFYDVSYRAEMEDGRPWNGHWTFGEVASMMRNPTADAEWLGLCAYDGQELVGAGLASFTLLDNTDKSYVFAMVDPPARGHGAGGALLEALVALSADRGRTTVTSNAAYAGPEDADAAPVRFASRHGFRVANTEIARHLHLPVEAALLDEVDTAGLAHRDGYTVETFTDGLPDELLPSYCRLVNQLVVDAPSGEVDYEEAATTPDIVREQSVRNVSVGRRTFHAVAVRDGAVVAQTDLAVQPEGTTAVQWGTFVDRVHRGHRLGAAVKVANLRVLQADRPDVTRVDTQNAETNSYMVSINERLGFEIAAVMPSLVRYLEA
ncbi:MAG: GNAT family N-acetyltransferase [Nocardioidaceae bacterium]